MVSPAAFAFALFFTLAARALPQAPIQMQYCSSVPSTLRATYNSTFDHRGRSMNDVACSDGEFGLAVRFPRFDSIPTFPHIGGAYNVARNSPSCGQCWSLTNPSTGDSVAMTAIDAAGAGFNVPAATLKALTKGKIGQGAIDVVAIKVPPSACGL
jgi:Cerato-platanin